MVSTLEATAPCRLELIGGAKGAPTRASTDGASTDGAVRLAVALDRRVFCRVEPREAGVEIHSKDTGDRVTAEVAREIVSGPAARVAQVLVASGVWSGVRVVTQVRVPEDAGLGAQGALEVAVRAALGFGVTTMLEQFERAPEAARIDGHAALFGGAHVLRRLGSATSVARVRTDPARLEECLLLVDPGPLDGSFASAPPAGTGSATGLVEALEAGAYDDVSTILTKVHGGRFEPASASVRKIVDLVADAGGAAWPSGRLVAVWAVPGERSPGPREVVSKALLEAGLRSFPARVDLRGLEVE
jgi:hypothetical protein